MMVSAPAEHHVEVQGGRFTVVVYHGDHRNIVVQVGLVLGDAVDQEAHSTAMRSG
jgi:hypothetical protein